MTASNSMMPCGDWTWNVTEASMTLPSSAWTTSNCTGTTTGTFIPMNTTTITGTFTPTNTTTITGTVYPWGYYPWWPCSCHGCGHYHFFPQPQRLSDEEVDRIADKVAEKLAAKRARRK